MIIGGKCISASLVTAEFLPSKTGTDLILTHQGAFFEGADGPEMRESGWRKLLDNTTNGDRSLVRRKKPSIDRHFPSAR